MSFLGSKLALLAHLILLAESQTTEILAKQLPYLHKVAAASADVLLGAAHLLPLGTSARARSLKNSAGQSVGIDLSASGLGIVNQTIVVSYRYPQPSEHAFDEMGLDPLEWVYSSDDRAPYRLLSAVHRTYNLGALNETVSKVHTARKLIGEYLAHKTAANVVARNMVLARLYYNLMGPSPGQLGGLQTQGLPIDCAYLTGLHMEVLTVPSSLNLAAVLELLLRDPFVEEVYLDEVMDGKALLREQPTLTLHNVPPPAVAIPAATRSLISVLDTLPGLGPLPDRSSAIRLSEDAEFEPFMFGVSIKPNDTHYMDQWAHHNPRTGIATPEAWKHWTASKSNFVIALVDSGVDLDHPDLRPQYWRNQGETDCFNGIDDDGNGYIDDCIGWDWIDNDNVPQDENGHGTASAGIMAAVSNNGMGVTGVCWGCKIMVLRTLDKDIRGTISGFIKAIDYAVVEGAKVSNNSYGGRGSSFASLKTAVKRARKQGMIFVAAAGNYGSNNDLTGLQPTYPASYNDSNILSVAAIDSDGQLAPFSCYGKRTVDVAAPGVKILSTSLNHRYQSMDGTSFATPFVSATAALIWSREPQLTADDVIHRIIDNVRPLANLRNKVASGGSLNVHAALTNGGKAVTDWTTEDDAESRVPEPVPPTPLRGPAHKKTLREMRCATENICPQFSECVDTASGLRCRCRPGFKHQGGKCSPVAGSVCHPDNAALRCPSEAHLCEETDAGRYQCRCKPGYVDDGPLACKDTDECALDPHICPRTAKCINTVGAFECQCPPGQKWNGLALIQQGARCVAAAEEAPRDPCFLNGGCGEHSLCVRPLDYMGKRQCVCVQGYVKDVEKDACVVPSALHRTLEWMKQKRGVPRPRRVK